MNIITKIECGKRNKDRVNIYIDEEYASYASSTSTDIVTEYDPETAVGTIRVAKKDSDDPTETEEVTGMTD